MVEAAGQSTFGASRSSHALIFFGPKCGNHRISTSTATSTGLVSEENFLSLFELYSREL
jgi:hypothetical protein